MSPEGYLQALDTLGLSPFGRATKAALGLQLRQLGRLAAGVTAPSPTLQRLLEALVALKTV
jgi:hypothetical protein